MTATRTCVIPSSPLGRRYEVTCSVHGRLSLPIDGETANDLVRAHNRSAHVDERLKAVEG